MHIVNILCELKRITLMLKFFLYRFKQKLAREGLWPVQDKFDEHGIDDESWLWKLEAGDESQRFKIIYAETHWHGGHPENVLDFQWPRFSCL